MGLLILGVGVPLVASELIGRMRRMLAELATGVIELLDARIRSGRTKSDDSLTGSTTSSVVNRILLGPLTAKFFWKRHLAAENNLTK